MDKHGALRGIKVLDFSQLLAGPYAAMMLGDMGAEVIKIERLESGDLYRGMTFGNHYMKKGISPVFLAWNRSKKSVSLDLKDEEVKKIIYEMVKTADIVIHNFRPDVMERLGYGYEKLKSINSKIIYACNSGFGPDGPYANRPGQDLLAQGLSGIMSLTGRKNSPPTPLGTGLADHLSAYHLIYGILSALFYREKSGQGQKVEVDLFRSMLAFMNQELATVLNTEVHIERPNSGIGLPFLDAPYGVYQCKDGYITIAMNDFIKLCTVLGSDELKVYDTEKKRYSHRDEIFEKIESITKKSTVEFWLDKMLEADLWVSKVNHIEDIESDPQVKHMETIKSYELDEVGKIKVIGPVVTMSETQPDIQYRPPEVGEHTLEILSQYTEVKTLEKLIEKGVLWQQ